MGHSRTALLPPLIAALTLVAACKEEPTTGDDDTTEAPAPYPCEDGHVLDPDLPAEVGEEYPDGCVPAACGIGRWGNLELSGETVFVDAHASEDGDGSEEAPFTSIQVGLDTAGDGGAHVVVAAGTYVENLALGVAHDGVHLAGRCRDLVVVDGSGGGDDESGIRAAGFMIDREWRVSGITVTNSPYAGIWLDGGRQYLVGSQLVGNRPFLDEGFRGSGAWCIK